MFKVTPQNLMGFVDEADQCLNMQQHAHQFLFRIYPFKGSPETLEVGVAIAVEVMQMHYMQAMEEVHYKAAYEFNKYFATKGMPAWVEHKLAKLGPSHGSFYLAPSYDHAPWQSLAKPKSYGPPPPNGYEIVATLRSFVPGIDAVVQCPATHKKQTAHITWGDDGEQVLVHGPVEEARCTKTAAIFDMVQHLNDSAHRWSREEIADWLETLDADLTFRDEPVPPRPIQPSNEGYWFDTEAKPYLESIKAVWEKEILLQTLDAPIYEQVKKQAATFQTYKVIKDELSSEFLHTPSNPLSEWHWMDTSEIKQETDPLKLKQIKNAHAPSYAKFTDNPTKKNPFKKK